MEAKPLLKPGKQEPAPSKFLAKSPYSFPDDGDGKQQRKIRTKGLQAGPASQSIRLYHRGFEAVEGECAANDQPGEQVNRRCVDQRQEIREPEKAACRPTPAQCSKWDAEQQAGAQRSETRTPHGELGECCGFVTAVNRKGICAPAKDTKKKQEDR